MLLTNAKVFLGALLKHRLLSLINILGLSIGMACSLLIALYALDELAYDRQHPDAERLVRVSSDLIGLDDGARVPLPVSAPQFGPLLRQNFPSAVEDFTRLAEEAVYLGWNGRGDYEEAVRFVDANFFTFFHGDWISGSPAQALSAPDTIVLTESMARRYFGSEEAMGRVLQFQRDGALRVTGVIQDLKNDTHISGDAFVSMSTLEREMEPQAMQDWFNHRFHTYIRLHEGVSFHQIQPAFHTFLEAQMPPVAKEIYEPSSIRVIDLHRQGAPGMDGEESNAALNVAILLVVGAALLIVACTNFVTLATARTHERSKEIAVRKVLGAARRQIFLQHMGETGAQVMLAMLMAIAVAELALPILNGFTNKALSLTGTTGAMTIIAMFGLTACLLAGAYPALRLSALRPVAVLKRSQGGGTGGTALRNLLVILQFSVAIVLIIGSFVIHRQVHYGKTIALGFDKNQVLVIERELGDNWEVARQRLQGLAGVSEVSAVSHPPFRRTATSIGARYEGGSPQGTNLSFLAVDFGYFELLDVEFLAGRSLALPGDRQIQPTEEVPHPRASFIINRAMVERLGWSVDDAVGKWIELNWSEVEYTQSVIGEVVGVIEDLRVDSLRHAVTPTLYFAPAAVPFFRYALVKLSTGNLPDTLQQLDALWEDVYPDQPVRRYFLDDDFQAQYEAEERQGALVTAFALLAVAIACSGLFALATLAVSQRSKEVGIRKVLGGSVWRIIVLLTEDLSKLVLLANVIAWPVAYVAMNRWLENFAYRIDLTPVIFVGSGLIALCIAWVTVGGTAAKAASARPVLALRYE